GLVLLATSAIFVMGQAQSRPRKLETEQLVIRYPNGKEAITLGTFPGSVPSKGLSAQAEFINPAGFVVARITADPISGGTVHVNSPTAELQMSMNASSTFPGADLSKQPVGESAGLVIIRTPKGPGLANVMFNLSADTTGETSQYLYSGSNAQLRLLNGPDGAALQLWDNPKTLRAVLGNTSIESVRSGGVETRALSSLVLFDKEGNVLWQAP